MSIILHGAKPSHQILSSVMNFSDLGQRLLLNCRGYIDYKETVKGYFPIDKPPHVILQLHSFHKLNGNPLDLINSHPGICCVVILTPTHLTTWTVSTCTPSWKWVSMKASTDSSSWISLADASWPTLCWFWINRYTIYLQIEIGSIKWFISND